MPTTSADRWTINETKARGRRVPLGPFAEDALPERFTASATDGTTDVKLVCGFDGVRIEVTSVTVSGLVTPGGLAGLGLPALVRACAEARGTVQQAAHVGRRDAFRLSDDELKLVAAVVAWHHATWGRPREAVAFHWGISPRTATRWIARAAELYPLPKIDRKGDA